ncbi:threonine/serine exporter family protein [Pengzhenrongella sicca]|uniref:Threonine/serine exporter family protein n=1 Tax=Pengzhenrongella sicca TaxID=2819238 RepID=A0A8A4ZFR5_9MICO|nr:threonine/serine exporter family protein [Pengzhenrongella sicca]QTE30850.1 threonine/serine exporter family protein [Pengzhenrongella sicca]
MRGSERLRQLARQVIAGTHPGDVGLRARDAGLDEVVARGALELALRFGEAMFSLGASAADVRTTINRTVRAFGLDACQVEVGFSAITLAYDPGGSAYPMTLMRVIRTRNADYGRLASILELATQTYGVKVAAEDARDRLDDAHAALDAIVTAPRPYSRWVVTLVLSVLAAGVAFLLGGGPAVAVVAAATTALIDRVLWALDRFGLPPFFLQGIGAAIATLVAVGLFLAAPTFPGALAALPPSLVVASGIVVLLAGLSLVGAAEDAISGFAVTAGGRTFEVVVLTLGIVVGIGGVLDVARRAGVPLEVLDIPANTAPLMVQAASAAVVAGAWGVASYARPRAAVAAAVVGGLSWVIYVVAGDLGLGPAVASALAALVVGFLGVFVGPRLGVTPIVISVCGIVPLLPGLAIYRALFQLINEHSIGIIAGASGLLGAALIGLGLAAGVTLGEFLAAPLRRGRRPRRENPLLWRRRAVTAS